MSDEYAAWLVVWAWLYGERPVRLYGTEKGNQRIIKRAREILRQIDAIKENGGKL